MSRLNSALRLRRTVARLDPDPDERVVDGRNLREHAAPESTLQQVAASLPPHFWRFKSPL